MVQKCVLYVSIEFKFPCGCLCRPKGLELMRPDKLWASRQFTELSFISLDSAIQSNGLPNLPSLVLLSESTSFWMVHPFPISASKGWKSRHPFYFQSFCINVTCAWISHNTSLVFGIMSQRFITFSRNFPLFQSFKYRARRHLFFIST